MNKELYDRLRSESRRVMEITLDDLHDQSPRTLIYGYDCDRNTFHAYVEDDELHIVAYTFQQEVIYSVSSDKDAMSPEGFIPNKRIYPECCDFEFCQLLKNRGIGLPFTAFNEAREPVKDGEFYGKTLNSLTRKVKSKP